MKRFILKILLVTSTSYKANVNNIWMETLYLLTIAEATVTVSDVYLQQLLQVTYAQRWLSLNDHDNSVNV